MLLVLIIIIIISDENLIWICVSDENMIRWPAGTKFNTFNLSLYQRFEMVRKYFANAFKQIIKRTAVNVLYSTSIYIYIYM